MKAKIRKINHNQKEKSRAYSAARQGDFNPLLEKKKSNAPMSMHLTNRLRD